MAEIRCQMCGKPNPADAEVCQFCQARLKPIWASKPEEGFFDAEPEPEEEIPDWLSSLRGSEEPAAEESEEEQPEAGLFGGIEARETAGSEEWLSGLEKVDETPFEAVGNVFDLQPGEELSDWLSPSEGLEVEQPEMPGEVSGEAGEGEQFSEEKPAEEILGGGEQAVDWLGEATAAPAEGAELPKGFPFEQAPTEEEVPDWLTRMTLGEAEIPAEPPSTPDWLKESAPAAGDEYETFFASESESTGTWEEGAAEPGALDAGIDWMTGVYGEKSAEGAEEPAEQAEGTLPEQEGFPDWLSALGVTQEQEPPQTGIGRGAISAEVPGEEAEQPFGEQAPDWLSSLSGESWEPIDGEKPETQVPAFDDLEGLPGAGKDQEMPDWLANLETEGLPLATGGPAPFIPDEPEEAGVDEEYVAMPPEWLSQVGGAPKEASEGLPPAEAEAEPGLERAELPNWLEAMRPIEALPTEPFKDESDSRIESQGPLSGLRGALPIGQLAPRPRRPATSALKIQVPEEQQNRAMVLEKLVEDESTAKPLPAPSLAAAPILLRVIIFGLFILACFFALWVGGMQVPLPSQGLMPPGVRDFHAQIDGLARGAPVLFAVDYEPGFSGELETTAVAALSHLARKGTLVTFVSTTYNGPALAQRLLRAVNQRAEFLQAPFSNVRNMGYIPGGVAGLAAFARTPDAVLPYDLNDSYLWSAAPFDRARGLKNFAMVVVLTHDADTARAWVEQVGPALGDIPLQLAVSAQAEPLVQPYYAGIPRQVSGLVGGLAGGVAYETLGGHGELAVHSWDAFSISLTIAVVLILVGGFLGVGSVTLSQYKQAKAGG